MKMTGNKQKDKQAVIDSLDEKYEGSAEIEC